MVLVWNERRTCQLSPRQPGVWVYGSSLHRWPGWNVLYLDRTASCHRPDTGLRHRMNVDPAHLCLPGPVASEADRCQVEPLLQCKLRSEWVLFILESLSCFSVGRHLDLSSSLPLGPVWRHTPSWRQNVPTGFQVCESVLDVSFLLLQLLVLAPPPRPPSPLTAVLVSSPLTVEFDSVSSLTLVLAYSTTLVFSSFSCPLTNVHHNQQWIKMGASLYIHTYKCIIYNL